MTTDLATKAATKAGYDLSNAEQDQGPPDTLSTFSPEDDDSITLHVSQDEVEDYERFVGKEHALLSDILPRADFDKFIVWLEHNVEGGVHHFNYWTRQDDDDGFASHLEQRYRAALDEPNAVRARDLMMALEKVAELYDIKL